MRKLIVDYHSMQVITDDVYTYCITQHIGQQWGQIIFEVALEFFKQLFNKILVCHKIKNDISEKFS